MHSSGHHEGKLPLAVKKVHQIVIYRLNFCFEVAVHGGIKYGVKYMRDECFVS